MKIHWGILISAALFWQPTFAYDPCDVKYSLGSLAENQCYRIPQKLSDQSEEFILSAVKLTKELSKVDEKTDIVLIPGGPGTDSQAIGLSLNKNGMMDALWAHMNLNVVLYDPRGTGASVLRATADHYVPAVFSTEVQVEDLKKVVDSVSPQKPVYLLAHSAGGNLAARYAALYPQRVKGLILYSASIDTREIGESNLRLFAKDFSFWDEHIQNCPISEALMLKEKQVAIEAFLRNVLKLQRLKNVRPYQLQSRFYLKDFRIEMIAAIENDPSCSSRVVEVLDRWAKRISEVPEEIRAQVSAISPVQFDPKNHTVPKLTRGTWIKTAVICSEGITSSEMEKELWLEGIVFSQDTCSGVDAVYATPPSREWLVKITAPTLLIGGSEDPFQIPSAVMRNAKAIRQSEVVLIKGGGHESHVNSPMEFYKALSQFLK